MKTNRIGLFSFKIETNDDKQNILGFPPLTLFYSLTLSPCVCVLKVQLLLLDLMYDSSIVGPPFSFWNFFRFPFLDSFVLLLFSTFFVIFLVCLIPHKLLVSFNSEHSFVIVLEAFSLALLFYFLSIHLFSLSRQRL